MGKPDKIPGKNGFKYRRQYGVDIICANEAQQIEAYNQLKRQGYRLKVVSV